MLGFLKLWEGLEAVLYAFKAVCVRSHGQLLQGFTTRTRALSGRSTISIGYRLIESYQPTGKRLSIEFVRKTCRGGCSGGHIFLKGRGVANIFIYMYIVQGDR